MWTDFWSEAHPWNRALSILLTAANWNTSNETKKSMIFCTINVMYERVKKLNWKKQLILSDYNLKFETI
jgi:hypothetical protein